jgi:hypothetical protein
MGKAKRYLIIILFAMGSLVIRAQEKQMTFAEFDSLSLDLYNKGKWQDLTGLCNEALREGFDYYYLRMRAGIASYETGRYMKASLHFRKALGFNENDPLAEEYLYDCSLELNRNADAYNFYDHLPASSKEKLRETLPKLHRINLEAGPVFSDQMQQFDLVDLDGNDNIYGEVDLMRIGYYASTGLSWGFKKGYCVYGSFSQVGINKEKRVQINDSLYADDKYPLNQQQYYLSGMIPVGKGFYIVPAINFIRERYTTVMPQYDSNSLSYLFPYEKTNYNSYIGYLSVTRDFHIVQTSLFGAYSNLNDKEQIQAGFQVVLFPYGNLDFYLSSKLLNHRNDGHNSIIYEQVVGAKLFRPVWIELNATMGQMKNYYSNNAFVVFNIADKIQFKGGAKLIFRINSRWMLTADYIYLLRRGDYVQYSAADLPEGDPPFPVTLHKDFQNHIIVIGLNWKF